MLNTLSQDLNLVRDYYSKSREVGDTAKTIYQIWEEGEAFGDSITPSTYCHEYQSHVTQKILGISGLDKPIFSIGCGNAAIEGRLVQHGRKVRAVDCNEEAVALAQKKGVDASVDDFMTQSTTLADTSLIYADGLVGHLFDEERGLSHFFEKLRDLGVERGTYIFISNDGPYDKSLQFEKHKSVNGFWFVSLDYLARSLEQAGFTMLERYTFPYQRPNSGLRNRTMCLAQV